MQAATMEGPGPATVQQWHEDGDQPDDRQDDQLTSPNQHFTNIETALAPYKQAHNMWAILIATVVAFGVARFCKWVMKSKRTRPPRVPGLPLLGNAIQVKTPAMHETLSELAEKYGEIFTINMAGTDLVVVNSAKLIHEASSDKAFDFVNRVPPSYLVKKATYGCSDIFFHQYDEVYQLLRKTVCTGIEKYGEENILVQELMQNEIESLIEKYDGIAGHQAVNPQPQLRATITNIMASLLIGRKIETGSTEAKNIENMVTYLVFITTPGFGAELDLLPFLRWVPNRATRCLQEYLKVRDAALTSFFEEAKAAYDPNFTRSYVEKLIKLQKGHGGADGKPLITDENILGVMLDMFIGGVQSTFSTISTLMLVCLHQPDVQRKLQDEIDRVIGQHSRPLLRHKRDMNYLSAVTLETLRYASVVALVPRATTRDTTLGGYQLDKGTGIILNIWEVNHSKDWEEPWAFQPERFLDENGELLPADHPTRLRLTPFGVGPRSCVGEIFGKRRLFMFIATLWQRFSFVPIADQSLPSCDPRDFDTTMLIVPKAFKCRIMRRN